MLFRPAEAGPAFLFCPATRPDRFAKALERADALIVDLEDAVPRHRKDEARRALAQAWDRLPPDRVIIRVNAARSPEFAADLDLITTLGASAILLPKAESADDLAALGGRSVIATCETAAGVVRAPEIAAASACVGLAWGPEDLIASAGGWSSQDAHGRPLDVVGYARAAVLLAAAAAGKFAVDAPHLRIDDEAGLRQEAEKAARMGFAAKAAIHPSQCDPIRESFMPSEDVVRRAREQVEAARDGVSAVSGHMVDEPIVAQARRLLARYNRARRAEKR